MQNESTNPYKSLFPKVEQSTDSDSQVKVQNKSRFNDDVNQIEQTTQSEDSNDQVVEKKPKKGRFNDENPFFQARQTYGEESSDQRVKIKKESKDKTLKEEKKEYPSAFGWFLTLFLTIIPIVGLVHICHLAFNKTHMKAKTTFARGVLILLAFIIICLVVLIVSFGGLTNAKEAILGLIDKIKNFFKA